MKEKMLLKIFLAFLILYSGKFSENTVFGLLIEELKSINYEVDIVKTPVRYTEENSPFTLHIQSKYGQKYQCVLPQIEEDEAFEKKETIVEEDIDVKELLKPVQMGPCLLKTKDWWTYEFCFGHYINQYHIEDGKLSGSVLSLGLYESDYDWNNETEDVEEKFRHTKQRYHSQTYSNGTRCDLTGLPRSTEVRFFCEEDAGDYISRVDEPATCMYILTIHTSRLCSHPRLKPLPSTKARLVSCSPLLDDEQYSLYLKKVDEERVLAENKRIKWLSAQQERLKAMKDWHKNMQQEANNQMEASVISNDEVAEVTVTNEVEDSTLDEDDEIESGFITPLPSPPQRPDDEDAVEKLLLQVYNNEFEKITSLKIRAS